MKAVSVAAMTVVLAATPAWAQGPAPCRVLCSPEFKIEPTVTFTNPFARGRLSMISKPSRDEPKAADRMKKNGSKLECGVSVRLEIDEQHFAHDRRDRCKERGLDVRRQRPGHKRELLGHGLAGAIDVLPPVEFHPDDGDPDGRCGPDAADTRRAVQRRLDREGNERFDFERIHAGRLGKDGDVFRPAFLVRAAAKSEWQGLPVSPVAD